jgi:hypothetical protein
MGTYRENYQEMTYIYLYFSLSLSLSLYIYICMYIYLYVCTYVFKIQRIYQEIYRKHMNLPTGPDLFFVMWKMFQVSFRSLVGFLPAWELSAQRRPPSFRTWAMDKGFTLKEPKFTETFIPDSSLSRVELPMGSRAVVGSETSKRTQESSIRVEDDNQRNLLKQYREERRNALSKLVGEVSVLFNSDLRKILEPCLLA